MHVTKAKSGAELYTALISLGTRLSGVHLSAPTALTLQPELHYAVRRGLGRSLRRSVGSSISFNTMWTADADLRLCITIVKDG